MPPLARRAGHWKLGPCCRRGDPAGVRHPAADGSGCARVFMSSFWARMQAGKERRQLLCCRPGRAACVARHSASNSMPAANHPPARLRHHLPSISSTTTPRSIGEHAAVAGAPGAQPRAASHAAARGGAALAARRVSCGGAAGCVRGGVPGFPSAKQGAPRLPSFAPPTPGSPAGGVGPPWTAARGGRYFAYRTGWVDGIPFTVHPWGAW